MQLLAQLASDFHTLKSQLVLLVTPFGRLGALLLTLAMQRNMGEKGGVGNISTQGMFKVIFYFFNMFKDAIMRFFFFLEMSRLETTHCPMLVCHLCVRIFLHTQGNALLIHSGSCFPSQCSGIIQAAMTENCC